jgi:hypothetical protein
MLMPTTSASPVHVSPVVVAIHDEDEPLAEQMYMRAPDLMKPGEQSAAHAKPFATAPLDMLQPLADVHAARLCVLSGVAGCSQDSLLLQVLQTQSSNRQQEVGRRCAMLMLMFLERNSTECRCEA